MRAFKINPDDLIDKIFPMVIAGAMLAAFVVAVFSAF
jgi:hypothetical protein